MEVRRIDPESGLLRTFSSIDDRLKRVETRATGEVVVRDAVRARDPETGVETIIGTLPDGSIGFQPFVGDTEPPPVPVAPTATTQPGMITVKWNGQFVAGAIAPRDFEHVNVIGHKMSGTTTVLTKSVGILRNTLDSVGIATDTIAAGETWQFSLQSEDYNQNTSALSSRSASVTMEAVVSDAALNDAIDDFNSSISVLDGKVTTTQNNLTTAQNELNVANQKLATMIAGRSNLILNGDFEQPNNLGWMFFSGTNIEASTGTARSGTKILRCTQSSGNRYAYTDYISSGTGRTFYVEYWVRLRETLVAGNETFTFGAYFSSLPAGVVATYGNAAPGQVGYSPLNTQLTMGDLSTTVWKKFSTIYTITSPDVVQTRFGPRIPGLTNLGNTVEVDDFRVLDITESFTAQTKADQAFNTASSAAQAAGDAQNTADGKNKVWYLDTAPAGTAHKPGDLWFNSAQGNRMYRWTGPTGSPANQWVDAQDTAIKAARDVADGAILSADGKTTTYYQGTEPSTATAKKGDIWFDTANSFRMKTFTGNPGGVWQTTQDSQNALNVANGKAKTYTQSSTPVGASIGDIWIDTTGGANRIKILESLPSGWVDRADKAIKTAQDTADAAQSRADQGYNLAFGKNVTYWQNSQPSTATAQKGDTWFDTSTTAYKMYTFTGNPGGIWQLAQDSASAMSIANGKNKVTTASTAPSSPNTGDVWIDTSNQNMMKTWSGPSGSPANSWISVRDAFIQQAYDRGDSAYTLASGKNKIIFNTSAASGTTGYIAGDIWYQRSATTGDLVKQWEFVTSPSPQWIERKVEETILGDISGNKLKIGTIDGDRMKANTISVNKLMVSDLTNFAPSYVEDPNAWTLDGGASTIGTSLPAYDKWRFRSTASTGSSPSQRAMGPLMTVRAGEELYAEGTIYRSTATTDPVYLRYYFYDKNKTYLTSGGVMFDGPNKGTASTLASNSNGASGTVHKITAKVPATPAVSTDVMYANVVVTFANATGNDISMYNVKGYRRNGGELLVDGTIKAGSAIIENGAIGTAHIEDAAITNLKVANDINASKIGAGFLAAARIEGGSINAEKLSVGAGNNLIADPMFSDPDLTPKRLASSNLSSTNGTWDVVNGEAVLTYTAGTHTSGQEGFQLRPVSSGSGATTMPLVPGQRYRIQWEAFRPTGTTPEVRSAIYYKNLAGTFPFVADSSGAYYVLPTENAWNVVTREWIAPMDAVSCAMDMQVRFSGNANGLKFRNPSMVPMVDATTITQNSINTTHIQSKSIGVDKLLISSTDNLISDATFTGVPGVAWGLTSSTYSIDSSGARNGGPAFKIANTNTQQGVYNFPGDLPITPGSSYRLSAWFKSDVAVPAGGVTLYIRYKTAAGTQTLNAVANSVATAADTWFQLSGTAKSVSEIPNPTNAHVSVSFGFFTQSSFSTGNVWCDYITANRMGDGQLIVDGLIQADSAIIGTGAIGTAQIADLAVTTAKVSELDASVIKSGFIASGLIDARSIAASKLTIGDITNLLDDSSFEAGPTKTPWIIGPGATVETDVNRNNTYVLKSVVAGRTSSVAAEQTKIAVQTGDTILVGGMLWLSTATTAAQQIRITGWYKNKAGNHVASAAYVDLPSGTASGWQAVGPTAIKITAANVESMNLQLNVSTTYAGTAVFDDIYMRKQVGATLIEDGAITTGHINTSGLNAAVIKTGTLDASLIGSKAIKTDQLMISSTNNLVVEADFSNNGTSWMLGTNVTVNATAGRGSGPALRITGTTAARTSSNLANRVTVGSEDNFRGSMYVKSTAALAAGTVQLWAKAYTTATASTDLLLASNTTLTANQWKLVEGFASLPANTIALEFYVKVTNNATGTITDIDYVSVTRATDGKLVVDGAIDGKTITGATINGSLIQTEITASRGIKLTSGELAGYDTSGNKNFSLTSAGVLSLKGAINSGSTITGATITGGTIRTSATNPRIEMTSSGLKGYDSSGAVYLDAGSSGIDITGKLDAVSTRSDAYGTRTITSRLGPANVLLPNAGAGGAAPGISFSSSLSPLVLPGIGSIGVDDMVMASGGANQDNRSYLSLTPSMTELSSYGTLTLRGNNVTIAGENTRWNQIVPQPITFGSSTFNNYVGAWVQPAVWRDPFRVVLTGLVGTSVTTITLAAGAVYVIAVLPTGYAPSADILFSPTVAPAMDQRTFLYIRANGNVEMYSPAAMSLSKANFYIALDGCSWLRTA